MMKILRTATIVLVFVMLAAPGAAAAGKTVVKLATLAPDGTVWHQTLQEMGASWAESSGNSVVLRIYPGGVAGDEPDLLRKMRIGQLHAASLSVAGLSKLDEGFMVFSIPMFYDSYDELFYVLDKLEPVMRKRLEEKGFVMLNWGHGGWVHFFTREPVSTIEDFKEVKMWTSAGDDRWVQWWKDNGFHPVALATTDLLTGLQTGMVDGLPTTPLAALSLQWFRHAPNMLDVGLAPLVGATVVSKRTWNRIPEELRPELIEAAEKVEQRLMVEVPAQDQSSVVEMKKRGLKVTAVIEGEHGGEWRKAAVEFAEKMRGAGMVPDDVFELALRAREEYRSNRATGGTN